MNTLEKIGKVILWILFWYYFTPYYLLKKYVFKHSKRDRLWSSLSSVVIVFILFCCWVNSLPDDDSSTSTTEPKVHYVVKKVGQKELVKAQAKEKVLDKEEKKEEAEYEKLVAALASAKTKAKKEKLAEEKAEKKAAKEAKYDNYSANSSQLIKTEHHHNSGAPAGNHGDMNTTDSGKIVGNRNSKIYHVPGQAGYQMNSANAVYFDSEAEAKAAGYRKALR